VRFEQLQREAREAWREFCAADRPRVLVGMATCGRAAGAEEVLEAVRGYFEGAGGQAGIYQVGCLGLCYAEPLVELSRPGAPRILYGNVTAENVGQLLNDYYERGDVRPDLALAVMEGEPVEGIPLFAEHPMMAGQLRIVLGNCGLIDPENIDHYIARGGYAGLAKALAMSPEEVIGFPTGLKWDFVRSESAQPKYVVANAEEGEAGTYKDRFLMEGDPHAVLEGILIAGYAVGARHGVVFVQAEYPRCAALLRRGVAQARERGLCGENILGSQFCFQLDVRSGVGGYVCGEETALLECLEGRRAVPRSRPPFPAHKGLWGQPTVVNNVETFANVPAILRHGAQFYREHGTQGNAGTKLFSLSGLLQRPGTVELPLGVTLRKVLFEIGGGLPEGRSFQAALIGGPTGGYVPEHYLDLHLDFDSLASIDAMMGSGGIVLLDTQTCIVDSVLQMTRFLAEESCGKCAPCRLGTQHMSRILQKITAGAGRLQDLETLAEIARTLRLTALCGLGQAAGNPVISSLRHFRGQYEAHIRDAACPAGVCDLAFVGSL